MTVTANGWEARLRVEPSTGEIRLNGNTCGAATVFNTDSIQVNGSELPETVSLTGTFAPGLTPEVTGGSEIEISFALGTGANDNYGSPDEVVVNLTGGSDMLVFTSDGIDVGNDLDSDILPGNRTERVTVYGKGGNDHIDASLYVLCCKDFPVVHLHGGPGRDTLIGSTNDGNSLFGEEGNDTLDGGNDADSLYGGPGDDRMYGYGGNDTFRAEPIADGADHMRGGDGIDLAYYRNRINGVTVTIGDAAPDGEPGEGDRVYGDVENVTGGDGRDVLVGNGLANHLDGFSGNDELYGGGGNDFLEGSWGRDILVGDAGKDTLDGSNGSDSLDGGLGADVLFGGAGEDILRGGPGADTLDGGDHRDEFFGDEDDDTFVNDDAYAETVDCGAGAADDPQASALDTFVDCELI